MGKWKNEMEELIMDISSPIEINNYGKKSASEKKVFSIKELSEKFDSFINELDYYSAIKYYSDIVSRAPSWVPAWNFLGRAYRAAGNVQYAYDAYLIGASRSGREQNWYELGEFCMGSGMHIEACRAYVKVLEKNPHNFGSYKNILYIFEKYINKFGNITLGIDGESRLFELEDEILEELVHSIDRSRESRDNKYKPGILCSVGMIFEARGYMDRAKSCYKTASEIENDRVARKKLSIFMLERGMLDEAYDMICEMHKIDPQDNTAMLILDLIEAAEEGKGIDHNIFDILKWYPSSPTINDYTDLKDKFIKTGEYKKGAEIFCWLDKFYPSDIALCRSYSSLLELAGMVEEAYRVIKKILMIKASPNTITIAVLFCIRNNMPDEAESLRKRYIKEITGESEIIIDNMLYLYLRADDSEREILSELTLVIRENVIDDLYNFMIRHIGEGYIKNDRIVRIIRTRFSVNGENTTDKLRICLFKIAANKISAGSGELKTNVQELLNIYDEDVYKLSNRIHSLIIEGYIDASKVGKIMKLLLQGRLSEYSNIISSLYWKESINVFNTAVLIMETLFDRKGVAAGIYQLLRQGMTIERKIDILNKCLEVYPTPYYYAKLAINYMAGRQWDNAVSCMNRLVEEFPDSKEADYIEKYLCWCDILMGIELGEINFDKYKRGRLESALHYIIHRLEGAGDYIPGLIDICRKQNNIVILKTINSLMSKRTEYMEMNSQIG